jgi:hypothetical protein
MEEKPLQEGVISASKPAENTFMLKLISGGISGIVGTTS